MGAATSQDFVEILGGNDAGANMGANLVDANNAGEAGNDIFCGRFFTAAAAMSMMDRSVCSRVTPFRLGVHFDDFENVGDGAADSAAGQAKNNEVSAATSNATPAPTTPLGTQGFSLGFAQLGC